MLQKVPAIFGLALRQVRAGYNKIVTERPAFADIPKSINFGSPAFENDGPIPAQFTADGDGLSPPLLWQNVPQASSSVALIIEDPDAPALQPLVHLLAWDLPAYLGGVSEGTFSSPDHDATVKHVGQNSYLKAAYLPPDPPPGHGLHNYVFQLFALDKKLLFEHLAGRADVVAGMEGHVLACGILKGTYERR